MSVLNSPLSAYSISAAVLCAVGILDVKVAVPVKMPLGKPASVLFRDLRSFHLPFKPSKMAAVGVLAAISAEVSLSSYLQVQRCFD